MEKSSCAQARTFLSAIFVAVLSIALMWSLTPILQSNVALAEETQGAEVETLANSSETVSVNCVLIGQNTDGNLEYWGQLQNTAVEKGSTAADLTKKLFTDLKITAEYTDSTEYGFYLTSITSPYDSTNKLGTKQLDANTWIYWSLFVDEKYSNSGASEVVFEDDGTTIYWIYQSDVTMPSDSIIPNPGATRPNWIAEWAGFAKQDSTTGNAATTRTTPKTGASEKWTYDWASYAKENMGSTWSNCSEPIIVNGYVYIAVDKQLLKIDKSTGKMVASANLAESISYTSRPVYSDGIVIVPLNTGRVQALTADSLETTWLTSKISDITQSSSTITIDGKNVYVATTEVDSNYNYLNGKLLCINSETGTVTWSKDFAESGFYWNGGAISGNYFVISTSSGNILAFNKVDGTQTSSIFLKKSINSDCVSDGSTIYLMSRDGLLNYLSLSSEGSISVTKAFDLGLKGSVCTPTVANGKLYVGGTTGSSAALVIFDLATSLPKLIEYANGTTMTAGSSNGVAGVPLVSTQGSDVYVYFTVNNAVTTDYVNYTSGGGVYSYKVGEEEATLIYDAADHHNFCDSPVICDEQGNLYYINDSGTLFALGAKEAKAIQMYRLYNQWSGEHLYTTDANEVSELVKMGWQQEENKWGAWNDGRANQIVYRLYNKYNGDHHYTMSREEYDKLVQAGWNGEDVAFYSDTSDSGIDVYRLFNPYVTVGTHLYTSSAEEYAVCKTNGWTQEGVSFKGAKLS